MCGPAGKGQYGSRRILTLFSSQKEAPHGHNQGEKLVYGFVAYGKFRLTVHRSCCIMGSVVNNFVSTVPRDKIAEFCTRWKIQELALFGSVLRDDFRPDSDLDFVVTFAADADWGLLDHIQMQLELQRLLDRDVDLISRRGLEHSQNWLFREEILKTAQVLFSSREVTYAAR